MLKTNFMNQRFQQHFIDTLGHTPTNDQERMIGKLTEFIFANQDHGVFLLKGYAGTGKTTLISALIRLLPKVKQQAILLAPTGRAAKVLASYSGKPAYTIHKKIYQLYSRKDGSVKVSLSRNPYSNAVFLVDEASMISDTSTSKNNFSKRSLLDDLMEYVFSGTHCKMILIGDVAQLPPVGLDLSPALNPHYLTTTYDITLQSGELKNVVRQTHDSGILTNATQLREKLEMADYSFPFFKTSGLKQVFRITGSELEEALLDTFNQQQQGESVVITRSNKRANIYNREIRKRILFKESELDAGDLMMVVKNNYYWLEDDSKAGFIANGDLIEIEKVFGYKDIYDFRFADVAVRLVDYPDEGTLRVKLLLNTLESESPALTYDENQKLFNNIMADFSDIPQRRKKMEQLKNSPYFNALQVKFAYSLTCHKTQGGQWENVFVEQGFFRDDMLNEEYLRWLYTALTRASKQLYHIITK